MSNEITLSGSLAYEDSEDADLLMDVSDLQVNVSVKKFVHAKQSVGTSEEAINLGEVTSPGFAFFRNRDATNYVNLKTGTGGTVFCKLLAGETAGPFRLGSGAQVPYAIADTAACQLEYLIVST